MDLEPGIQSKVSQKEKKKYCILMHICGIQKIGLDDFICRAGTETEVKNKCMATKWGKKG